MLITKQITKTKKDKKNDIINNRMYSNNNPSSYISKLWDNNINKTKKEIVMKKNKYTYHTNRMSTGEEAIQDVIDNLKGHVETINKYGKMVDLMNKDVDNGEKYNTWVLDTLKLATQKSQGRGDYTQNKCKPMEERFTTMIEQLESFRKHYLTWIDKLDAPLEKLFYTIVQEDDRYSELYK